MSATVDLELRRLTFADLPQVVAIERRCFATPWSLAMFVLELSKPGGVALAALVDGRLVGYLVCSRLDLVWHVMDVSVDPSHRRRGIARALLAELLAQLDDPEAKLTLEVRPTNTPAIRLYETSGFLVAGRRPRYYQDDGEDALLMWRTPATLEGRLDDVPGVDPARRDPAR